MSLGSTLRTFIFFPSLVDLFWLHSFKCHLNTDDLLIYISSQGLYLELQTHLFYSSTWLSNRHLSITQPPIVSQIPALPAVFPISVSSSAQTLSLILDSSPSFSPHIQFISKFCHHYFQRIHRNWPPSLPPLPPPYFKPTSFPAWIITNPSWSLLLLSFACLSSILETGIILPQSNPIKY